MRRAEAIDLTPVGGCTSECEESRLISLKNFRAFCLEWSHPQFLHTWGGWGGGKSRDEGNVEQVFPSLPSSPVKEYR